MILRRVAELGRGRLPLTGAVFVALVLVLVAAFAFGDPTWTGRAALREWTQRAARATETEWARLREDLDPWPDEVVELEWEVPGPTSEPLSAPGASPSAAPGTDPGDAVREDSETVELMLAASRAREEPADARALLEEALTKEPSPRQRAEAHLRLLQLAVRAGDSAAVVSAFDAGFRATGTPTDGQLARDGTSLWLLAVLVVLPHAEEDFARALARRAAERWASGELALPSDDVVRAVHGGPWRYAPDPRRVALSRRLRAWDRGERIHTSFVLAHERARQRAWSEQLGALPSGSAREGWQFIALDTDNWFAWRGAGGGRRCRGRPLERAEIVDSLLARLAGRNALPEGFVLTDSSRRSVDDSTASTGDSVALAGLDLQLRLEHVDPAQFVRDESRRLGWVRASLLATALACLVAGWVVDRALRRERRLAELKMAFIANVSHELRTPLASILLLAENLESGRMQEKDRKRYHVSLRREATRLRRLVDDVLDFARLERGRSLELAATSQELVPFLDELEAEIREWATRNDVRVLFARRELPARATIDRAALRRAVANLLANALAHSGESAFELRASGAPGVWTLAVVDHGRGVPVHERERILQPFERSARAGVPGTGLGLSLVREIARAHGGDLRVGESDRGGALFELYLPCDPVAESTRGADSARSEASDRKGDPQSDPQSDPRGRSDHG